jgi:hypothetical protein
MISASECLSRLRELLPGLLEQTGFLSLREVTVAPFLGTRQLDLLAVVEIRRRRSKVLVFDVRSIGQPRYVQMAVEQLRRPVADLKDAYGVFCAPYITPAGADICRQNGVGFVDLAGNCFLSFDEVYIDIQGRPNPFPNTRPLKSLFAPKSSRAVRVLLGHPGRAWHVQDLAREAGLSLGQVSQVKQRLLDYELIVPVDRAFALTDPWKLLSAWAKSYSYDQNDLSHYYSFEEPQEVERRLGEYGESAGVRYGLTLFSGAARVAPFTRYQRAFACVEGATDQVARALAWKEVSSGPTLTLLRPYDEGVFYGLQEVDGLKVVSDVQLYLDLQGYPGRGQEAAEFLWKQRMEPSWQHAQTTSISAFGKSKGECPG